MTRQALYEQLKAGVRQIPRQPCETEKVETAAEEACPDHSHILVRMPLCASAARSKLAYDLRAAYEHEVRHGDVEIAVRMYRGAAGQAWRNPFAISPKKMQPLNRSSRKNPLTRLGAARTNKPSKKAALAASGNIMAVESPSSALRRVPQYAFKPRRLSSA